MKHVGTSNLGLATLQSVAVGKVHDCGQFSIAEKQALVQAMRISPLVVAQSADSSANNSTTYTDSADLKVQLYANRTYKVKCFAHLTQAVAADGIKAQLLLSGTQTTAFANGSLIRFFDNGVGADTTDMVAVSISSGAVTAASDADSGVVVAQWELVLVTQNDGILSLQHGEVANAGAGGSVLKKGSFLEISEVSVKKYGD